MVAAARLVVHVLVAALVLAQAVAVLWSGTGTLQTSKYCAARSRVLFATGLAKARLRELPVLA